MLYDQAEAVMAALADAYPTREIGMVLRPRDDEHSPRDYAVQTSTGSGSIDVEGVRAYEAIATSVSETNTDVNPVKVRFDSTGGPVVVVFD